MPVSIYCQLLPISPSEYFAFTSRTVTKQKGRDLPSLEITLKGFPGGSLPFRTGVMNTKCNTYRTLFYYHYKRSIDIHVTLNKPACMEIEHCCKNCRNWQDKDSVTGECHGSFPQTDGPGQSALGYWPRTLADWSCEKFRSNVVSVRSKMSDHDILEIVRQSTCAPQLIEGQTFDLAQTAMRRSALAGDLMSSGITATPALKRILRLIRDGKLLAGENPLKKPGDKPGTFVWLPGSQPTQEDLAEKQELDFLAMVRTICAGESQVQSLRSIHRALEMIKPISIATVSRKVAALVEAGKMKRNSYGYYVPDSPTPASPTVMEVE